MFTSVGEHGMVPLLVPGVFPPVDFFHAGTRVLQRHVAPSLHLFLFLWKMFLLPFVPLRIVQKTCSIIVINIDNHTSTVGWMLFVVLLPM